jgi:hypothetical protein
MKGPTSKNSKNLLKKSEPQREHQVLEPFLITRNISNKERGGPFQRTPSIKGPSSTTIAHLKIKIAYAHCNATIDTFSNSLMDSTTSPKVKTMEGEGVGVHSLACNTLGVEGHVG